MSGHRRGKILLEVEGYEIIVPKTRTASAEDRNRNETRLEHPDLGQPVNRRRFLKTSGAAVAVGAVSPAGFLSRARRPPTTTCCAWAWSAAAGAARAPPRRPLAADSNVRLVAMGDAFPDRLEKSLATVTANAEGRLEGRGAAGAAVRRLRRLCERHRRASTSCCSPRRRDFGRST